MNRIGVFSTLIAMLLSAGIVSAQRIERTINESWQFTRDGMTSEVVNIPHSWNRLDSVDDTPGYLGVLVAMRRCYA